MNAIISAVIAASILLGTVFLFAYFENLRKLWSRALVPINPSHNSQRRRSHKRTA